MDDGTSVRTRVPQGNDYYYSDQKYGYANDYPPPMPAYTQQYGYAQSVHSSEDPSAYYVDSKHESQTTLTAAAAPIANQGNVDSYMANPHSANYNGGYGHEGQNGGYSNDGYGHGYAGYGQDVPGAYAVSGNEYGQYGQAYSNNGHGYEQDIGQAQAYAYQPQTDYSQSHVANAPARTASRAQNSQYDTSYSQSRQGRNGGTGTGGYDAYGHNKGM